MNARLNLLFNKIRLLINKWSTALIIVLFIISLAFFGYVGLINTPPQSTHLWRQSDCTSLAQNYYQGGMKFFQPEIHNLHADGGTSGYAISECPILYYIVAGFYKIFGKEYWVYRGFWTVILILGFFAIFKFYLHFTSSRLHAFLGSILIYTSPVLIFYGNSFLPDVPALAFTLLGWMFFAKWLNDKRDINLWLVAIFFMLGGLLKVTALISFFSLAGVWFLEIIGFKFGQKEKIFKSPWKSLIPFISVFIVVAAWYFWAWNYNRIHGTNYFLMRTCAIWDLSTCSGFEVGAVLNQLKNLWLPHLLNKPMQILLLFSGLFIAVFYKYTNRFLAAITIFSFLGSVIYALLFFAFFHNHDYYIINLYIFPIFLLLTFLNTLSVRFNGIYNSLYLGFALVLITLYSIDYTSKKQRQRYKGWMNSEHLQFSDVRRLAPLLDQLGIDRDDYIISIPDRTPNYTLDYLNRKGWTVLGGLVNDSIQIEERIKNGAKFLIINDFQNEIEHKSYLKSFISYPIGNLNSLEVFRIDGEMHPVKLSSRVDTLLFFLCNAERLSQTDSALLKTSCDSCFVSGGETRSSVESLSGNFAIRLNTNQQFGFTTKLKVIPNTKVQISVWRKSTDNNGFLVLSGVNSRKLYITSNTGIVDSNSGWEKLTISLEVEENNRYDEIMTYVYNPDGQDVFFDDFEVLVTKSSFYVVSAN